MSAEELKRLDADIKGDEALAAKFKQCTDVDAFVSLATSKGYNISTDDIQAANTKNLSDEELDDVAGGQFVAVGMFSAVGVAVSNP